MINLDYSFLLSNPSPLASAGPRKTAPRPPWDPRVTPPPASELVKSALLGRPFINVAETKAKLPGAEADYAELFSLYNGMSSLEALAQRMDARGVGDLEKRQLTRRFDAGMKELGVFVDKLKLDKLKLVRGDVGETAKSVAGVRRDTPQYRTAPIHSGAHDTPVAAWSGEVRFSMTLSPAPVVINTYENGQPKTTTIPSGQPPVTVAFDLAELGPAASRTVGAVVNYLNGKLEAAGVQTRFERERIAAEPRSVKVGEKTVTLPAGPDQWALKLKGSMTEIPSFTAPAAADAVYLAQSVGDAKVSDPAAQSRELLKFQTDVTGGAAPPATEASGSNWVDGRVFAKTMDADVAAVRASATAADGSVYMLAELTGDVAGQDVKGRRDAALLKYDSAGQLLWSRTLGAADEARADAIAVSADGKVAIGGTVTGGLGGAGAGATAVVGGVSSTNGSASLNQAAFDSFVTVFDAEGSEQWTRRAGALKDDGIKALAFGADGAVYAAGRTDGAMPGGAGGQGGTDGFVQGYAADGKLLWTQQYGTAEADGASALAVDGSSLVVAGVENGRAVLRRFDLSAPDARGAPTQAGTRDLGDVLGGGITGVALAGGRVTVVGSTGSGSLNAGAVNRAHGGGKDAFVASLDGGLAAGATDRITYWGGAGEDAVSAAVIRGGEVWLTGSSTGEIAGTTRAGVNTGDRDGFVARMDSATGTVGWIRRWTAKDGEAVPSSIAVAAGGASVLDRLGLPKGAIDFTGAQEITASTSARAGDRFYVKVNGGRQVAVTLEAKDTLKTLTERINRSLGFNGRAEVVRSSVMAGSDGAPLPGAWDRIEIKSRNTRATLELIPGEAGRDLLGVLGLMEGTVQRTPRDAKGKEITPEGGKTFGLKLARDLKLDSKEEIKRTVSELETGKNTIRSAYRALADALKPPAGPAVTGTAPAWMQAQTANYQAALSRLGG